MRLGPIEPRLPGVFFLDIETEGDWVLGVQTEFGFSTKGIEQTILNQPRAAAPFFSGKIDPEAPFFYELAISSAVEKINQFTPGLRTQCLRFIFSELSRVSAHLKTIAVISKEIGVLPSFHYLMREREKILDLFELATGARHSLNICKAGGMSDEITEGFIERVRTVSGEIKSRFHETHSLLTENLSFKKRTKNKGVISKKSIIEQNIGGVIARSVGIQEDLRLNIDFYRTHGWNISICPDAISGGQSDIYSRYFIWASEIEESLLFLERVCMATPLGEQKSTDLLDASGSAEISVETQRGPLVLSATAPQEKDLGIETEWKTPSKKIVACIDEAMKETRREDVFLVLLSMNFSVSEVDL